MYKATIKVWVNEQELELYTIGYVATLLKRSVETLRAWERGKVIPKPMYRYKNNVRLYHPREVEVMKSVLKKYGKYGNKAELQKVMWKQLAEVRKELLDEQKSKVQADLPSSVVSNNL